MSRGLTASVTTQAGAAANRPLHLVEVYLDAATVYITDSYRSIPWNSNTYLATGHLLSFDGIDESLDLQVQQASVSLSGVSQEWVANVLLQQYIDRRIAIRKAFMNPTTEAVLVDPCIIFDGRMDSPSIEEDPASGQCTVTISASSHWVDFERRPGRHTNHQEQQIYYPGDLGFEYVSEINADLRWGLT